MSEIVCLKTGKIFKWAILVRMNSFCSEEMQFLRNSLVSYQIVFPLLVNYLAFFSKDKNGQIR